MTDPVAIVALVTFATVGYMDPVRLGSRCLYPETLPVVAAADAPVDANALATRIGLSPHGYLCSRSVLYASDYAGYPRVRSIAESVDALWKATAFLVSIRQRSRELTGLLNRMQRFVKDNGPNAAEFDAFVQQLQQQPVATPSSIAFLGELRGYLASGRTMTSYMGPVADWIEPLTKALAAWDASTSFEPTTAYLKSASLAIAISPGLRGYYIMEPGRSVIFFDPRDRYYALQFYSTALKNPKGVDLPLEVKTHLSQARDERAKHMAELEHSLAALKMRQDAFEKVRSKRQEQLGHDDTPLCDQSLFYKGTYMLEPVQIAADVAKGLNEFDEASALAAFEPLAQLRSLKATIAPISSDLSKFGSTKKSVQISISAASNLRRAIVEIRAQVVQLYGPVFPDVSTTIEAVLESMDIGDSARRESALIKFYQLLEVVEAQVNFDISRIAPLALYVSTAAGTSSRNSDFVSSLQSLATLLDSVERPGDSPCDRERAALGLWSAIWDHGYFDPNTASFFRKNM